jgi:hypothetical protein
MPKRTCRLCNSPLRVEAEALFSQGFSDSYIMGWLKEKGENYTISQIKTHLIKHVELKVTVEEKGPNPKKPTKPERTEIVNNNASNLKLSLPDIPDNLTFEELVTWVQASIGRIFIKQASIVEQCQGLYIEGEIKHPTEQIRGLKYLSDVLDLAWGYKPGVDLSRAIAVIEAEGYSITDERGKIDEEIERYSKINPNPTKSAQPKEE